MNHQTKRGRTEMNYTTYTDKNGNNQAIVDIDDDGGEFINVKLAERNGWFVVLRSRCF